jgi:hypothetical protein
VRGVVPTQAREHALGQRAVVPAVDFDVALEAGAQRRARKATALQAAEDGQRPTPSPGA